jgi:hypothetical protein
MQRSALIWILLAAMLGAGAWLATRPRSATTPIAPAEQSWLATLDATTLARIEIERPDGFKATLDWNAHLDSWTLESADGIRWPAEPARVRAAIRLLAEAANAPASPDDGSAAVAQGTTIRLTPKVQTMRSLRIAPNALGGKVVLAIDPPGKGPSSFRLADGGLATVFASEGIAAWRVDRPLASSDVSRLSLLQDKRTLALSRLKGTWRLRSPIDAPADASAVIEMIGHWHQARLKRFLSGPAATDALAGLQSPTAVVTLEQDLDASSPQGRATVRRVLTLGSASDATGNAFFASLAATVIDANGESNLWGPQVGLVERDAIASAIPALESVISKQSTSTPAPDVTVVRLWADSASLTPGNARNAGLPSTTAAPATSSEFRRGLSGWIRNDVPLAPSSNATLDRLVRLLAEQPAAVIRLVPINAESIAFIELANTSGTIREVLAIGVSPNIDVEPASATQSGTSRTPRPGIVVGSGNVWRAYASDLEGIERFVRDAATSK